MAFAGYLLKSGNDIFPTEYIDLGSYSCTPDQREEIKAYRDDNTRNLTRITASGTKTAIQFTTRKNLHLADKEIIRNWFYNHESNHHERKIHIYFWNDETGDYDHGDFYRPNMPFKIIRITEDDIIYDALQFDLVEY